MVCAALDPCLAVYPNLSLSVFLIECKVQICLGVLVYTQIVLPFSQHRHLRPPIHPLHRWKECLFVQKWSTTQTFPLLNGGIPRPSIKLSEGENVVHWYHHQSKTERCHCNTHTHTKCVVQFSAKWGFFCESDSAEFGITYVTCSSDCWIHMESAHLWMTQRLRKRSFVRKLMSALPSGALTLQAGQPCTVGDVWIWRHSLCYHYVWVQPPSVQGST